MRKTVRIAGEDWETAELTPAVSLEKHEVDFDGMLQEFRHIGLPQAVLIVKDGKPFIRINNLPGEKYGRDYEPRNTKHLPEKSWANDLLISQLKSIWERLGIK